MNAAAEGSQAASFSGLTASTPSYYQDDYVSAESFVSKCVDPVVVVAHIENNVYSVSTHYVYEFAE